MNVKNLNTKVDHFMLRQHGEWGQLFVCEDTYTISIISSFGNWAFSWSDIGTETFYSFLYTMHTDYLCSKLEPQKYFNAESTIFETKKYILNVRKLNSITKKQARDAFNILNDLQQSYIPNEDVFYSLYKELKEEYNTDNSILDDYDTFIMIRTINPQLKEFINTFWMPFIAWHQEQSSKHNFSNN